MLPFLSPKSVASVISSRKGKHPDMEVKIEHEAAGGEIDPELKTAAEDVLRAIENKSVVDLANALEAIFHIADKEPHEEGEHIEGENE